MTADIITQNANFEKKVQVRKIIRPRIRENSTRLDERGEKTKNDRRE